MDPRFREDDEEELGMTEGGMRMTKTGAKIDIEGAEIKFWMVEPDSV